MNKDAADRIADNAALPIVGDFVHYYDRPSDIRARRPVVAALVVGADRENNLLDLVLFYDADDRVMQERVPRRIESDRGWLPRPSSAGASGDLDAFKADIGAEIFGEWDRADASVYDRLADLEKQNAVLIEAVERLEGKLATGNGEVASQMAAPPRRGRAARGG